jgi:hypothetical protein
LNAILFTSARWLQGGDRLPFRVGDCLGCLCPDEQQVAIERVGESACESSDEMRQPIAMGECTENDDIVVIPGCE